MVLLQAKAMSGFFAVIIRNKKEEIFLPSFVLFPKQLGNIQRHK